MRGCRRTSIRYFLSSRICITFAVDAFCQLKELEKLGPKLKGIGTSPVGLEIICSEGLETVSQSVKDVLQSLVDDGLVQADKIGSSNCESHTSFQLAHINVEMYPSFLEFSFSTWLHGVCMSPKISCYATAQTHHCIHLEVAKPS